jgi:hypothetical protein
VDLEPFLLLEGDLPRHLLPDFVSNKLSESTQRLRLGRLPEPVNFISRKFWNDDRGSIGGAVIIYLYDDLDTVNDVFQEIQPELDGFRGLGVSFPEVGEQAKAEFDSPQRHLIFTRCNAFVYIWMIDAREYAIVTYAQKIDARITPLVCLKE